MYFANAIASGLAEAMAQDESVVVLGEDVQLSTIGATKGLVERFGQGRVRNSPISEATVVGSFVGLMDGLGQVHAWRGAGALTFVLDTTWGLAGSTNGWPRRPLEASRRGTKASMSRNWRFSISVSRRSVFARRCSRDTATLTACMT